MAKYNKGDIINLEAIPDSGYKLESWTINGKPNGIKTTTYKHTVSEKAEIGAIFVAMIQKVTLTASVKHSSAYTGSGTTASINNSGKQLYTESVDKGSKVNLTVKTNPIIEMGNIDVTSGNTVYWEFVKWSDDNLSNPRSITVNNNIDLQAYVRVPARVIFNPTNPTVDLYNYYMYNYSKVLDANLKDNADLERHKGENKQALFESQRIGSLNPEGVFVEDNKTILKQLRNLYYRDMIIWWEEFMKSKNPKQDAIDEAWSASPYESYFATALVESKPWMIFIDPESQKVDQKFTDFITEVINPELYDETQISNIATIEYFYRNYANYHDNVILKIKEGDPDNSLGYLDYYNNELAKDFEAQKDISTLKEYLTKPLNIVRRDATKEEIKIESERYDFFKKIIENQIQTVATKDFSGDPKNLEIYISYALNPNYTIQK